MKNAIVTGALGAIGAAICVELRKSGYRIIQIDKPGPSAPTDDYFACDLLDPAAIASTLASVEDHIASCDLLVNNAGLYEPIGFFDLTAEDFDRTMNVNTRATFLLTQGFARMMVHRGRGGAVINIASISGRLSSPIIPYGTSKAAIIGMTRSLARVLAPHQIRVNAVAPGVIATPMTADLDPANLKYQLANVPMQRRGGAEEVASVVAFLAGEGASYMTGAILDVNGGWPC